MTERMNRLVAHVLAFAFLGGGVAVGVWLVSEVIA